MADSVRPGGLIVIDDAVHTGVAVDLPGYERTCSYQESREQLCAHGDRIVKEHLYSREHVRRQNERYQSWIESRATQLSEQHPDLTPALAEYVAKERVECVVLENQLQCVSWLLQRT